MKELKTDRLILRNWTLSDTDDFFEMLGNPNISIPAADLHPLKTRAEAERYLRMLIEYNNNYAIQLKENGKVIGGIGINEDPVDQDHRRNVGFQINEDYWNKGYLSEALEKVIETAGEYTQYLSMGYSDERPKTKHIAEKFNFKVETVFRNFKRKTDKKPQDEYYCILKVAASK